jgi:hypothetical protein
MEEEIDTRCWSGIFCQPVEDDVVEHSGISKVFNRAVSRPIVQNENFVGRLSLSQYRT